MLNKPRVFFVLGALCGVILLAACQSDTQEVVVTQIVKETVLETVVETVVRNETIIEKETVVEKEIVVEKENLRIYPFLLFSSQ